MSKVAPMFIYTSICCGVQSKKDACERQQINPEHKKKAEFTGLGHWYCPACGKGCSVIRVKNE